MEAPERYMARVRFQLAVHRASGQAYEDLFVQIQSYLHSDFRAVKPQGRIGDRNNDGYVPSEGRYYQVYAPEDPESARSKSAAAKKAQDDFQGLQDEWSQIAPIRDYRFVFNDKYKGSPPEVELALSNLQRQNSLERASVYLAKDLEDDLFSLDDDKVFVVLGGMSFGTDIQDLDFSVLTEVIQHIGATATPLDAEALLNAPDFSEKIKFNGISRQIATLLEMGSYQFASIDEYFSLNSRFAKQELRDQVASLYAAATETQLSEFMESLGDSDHVFLVLLSKMIPAQTKQIQDAALVVIAYFFEACDVFEDPMPEGSSDAASG